MEYVDHILTDQSVYKIRDAEAARVNNNCVGSTVWDSQTLVERMCPAFTVSGPEAVCYPVEGSQLAVTSNLDATQSGEGEPAPDNLRPIQGYRQIRINHTAPTANLTYDREVDTQVYGGKYHWDTGILELTHKAFTINETTELRKHPDGKRYYVAGGLWDMQVGSYLPGLCDTLPVVTKKQETLKTGLMLGASNNYVYLYNMEQLDSSIVDIDTLKAYLKEHPITFVYPLAEPELHYHLPLVITAFAGENRLASTTGDTQVSGRESLLHFLGGHDA